MVVAVAVAGPAYARAQAGAAPPAAPPAATAPAPPAAAAPPALPPPAAEPEEGPECTPEEPCLTAGRQEQITREHARALGFVDLSFGDSRIQADELDFFTTTHPDGRVTHRIEARNNVVFLRGEERLAGDSMKMDLSTGKGSFENALGYTSPGVFIEARRIERVEPGVYKIEGGRFTSCAQPTPRWSFSATSATIKVDDRILARNVVMKVKQVPAFYMPIFMYPIQEDQRSSGLLSPRFGKDTYRGTNIGTGFFWAMGRSFDQTFYFDHYSLYGQGYGHEFRYALASPSNGNFRTYLFRRKKDGQTGWEHDLNWAAVQSLPGKVRLSIRVQEASTIDFQEQFQDDLDLASRRNRFSTVSLQRSFGPTSLQLLANSNDTYYGFGGNEFVRRRQLPTLQVGQSPVKIARTGVVFSYDARAENLQSGDHVRVDTYGRYDVNPRLSRPFSLSFVQVTPEVQYRYTRYGASDLVPEGGNDDLGGAPITRQYGEASVDMRGPFLSRVFDTPGNFYSDRYKHVIGPEVTWTYRTRVEPDIFFTVPIFDGHDQITATNELRYSLVQRFYSKRRGAGGRSEPYEFLNWRISQTYYANADAAQYDPTYASSAFGAPGGEAASRSPIQSRFRFRPTRQFSTNFDLEYDVNFKQLKYVSLSTTANYTRASLQASWFRGNRLTQRVDRRGVNRDTIRGSARLLLWPGRVGMDGSAYYDLLTKELKQWSARLRYDVQCCGFIAEVIDSQYNAKQGKEYRFSVELANIGTVGNFGQGQGNGFRSAR